MKKELKKELKSIELYLNKMMKHSENKNSNYKKIKGNYNGNNDNYNRSRNLGFTYGIGDAGSVYV